MLLQSLTLENIGVYRGQQTVIFSTDERRPVTLIGGRNGTGKTSLLDSIPLVLYGSRARRILNGASYPEYLKSLVHHQERSASIALKFDRAEGGRQVQYVVKRTWKRTSRGKATDQLFVSTDNDERPDLVATWPEFVESIMPMAVADLTIFNGEKIESLADPASSTQVLKSGLYGLLGLNLVERLRDDLQNYRRRIAKTTKSQQTEELAEELALAEARLAEAQEEETAAQQACANAEGAKSDLENQLDKARDKLARAGGGLLAGRDNLHRQLVEANASADAVERELFQLVAGDLPLALVPDLLKLVVSAGEQLETHRLAEHTLSAMAERDGRIEEQLVSALGLGESDEGLIRDLLRTDLDSMHQPGPPNFKPTQECTSGARELLHRGIYELQTTAKRLTNELYDHSTNADGLEGLLTAVPDAGRIAPSVQLVATAEAELRAAEKSLEQAQLLASDALRRVEQAQRDADSIAHRVLDAGAGDRNAARITREVSAADEVLSTFAHRMVGKHLGRISKEINTALTTLLHKQDLVAGVSIEPQDLSISLVDSKGQPVDGQKLSAGERQIMATAVLWGLSRCTGMTLPTVIDTPVGRLDRSHRSNFIERYFPNASRQVVLLSTDEEIVGDLLQRLSPHIGVKYCLEFDDEEACTLIEMGYFDE
ncbi:MAG: DNA sulfur modification protein DndD [bacterium]|nr:DNA sulfur modification protein DndD [bacterium]